MKTSLRFGRISIFGLGLLLTLAISTASAQTLIGVNFQGRNNDPNNALAPTATAGVLPQQNWNNPAAFDQVPNGATSGFLNNSSGAQTGVTLTAGMGDAWSSGTGTSTPDLTLMNGILKVNTIGTQNLVYNGVPSGIYDVYVYCAENGTGAFGNLSIASANQTYYLTDPDGGSQISNLPANYSKAVQTTDLGASNPLANYVEFTNVQPDANGHITIAVDREGGSDGFGVAATQLLSLPTGPVWVGGGANDWGVAGNWNPTGVPAPLSIVTFGNTGASSIADLVSAGQSVGGINFFSNVSTTIQSSGGNTLTLDNGSSAVAVAVSGTHNITAAVALNSTAAFNVSSGGTLNISGAISDGTNGSQMLTVAGSGTLNLSGNNGYSGGTGDSGVLRVSNSSGSATGSGPVTVNGGGILGGSGTIITGANAVVVGNGSAGHLNPHFTGTGTATLNITGNLTLDAGSVLDYNFATGTGSVTPGVSDETLASGTLTLNGATTVNITGQTGFSQGRYTLLGYGTLSGFSAGSFSIGTSSGLAASGYSYSFFNDTANKVIDLNVLLAGTVKTWSGGHSNGMGGANWDTTTQNWNNGTATYNDGNPAAFQGADSVVFATGATTGNVNVTGNFSPTAVSITATDQNFNFTGTGSIGGTGLLTVNTPNRIVTLATANGYSGGTNLTAGQLNINNATGIGVGTLAISAGAGLGNSSGGAIALTSTNNVQTWAGSFNFLGPNDLNLGTGGVTAAVSPTINTLNYFSTLTVGGAIGPSTVGLTKTGPGGLALGGANAFTGLTLNQGTLVLNNNTALGAAGGTFALGQLSSALMLPLTVDTNTGVTLGNNPITIGNTVVFPNSGGNITFGTGTVTDNGYASGNTRGSAIDVLSGTVTINGAVQVSPANFAGALNKQGPGTLQLNSTYGVTSGTAIPPLNIGMSQNGTFVNNGGTVLLNSATATFATGTSTIGPGNATSAVNLFDNGVLTLDNTTSPLSYRLAGGSSAATTVVLSLNGNVTANIIGNASTTIDENVGTLAFSQGNATGGGTSVASSGSGTLNLLSNGAPVLFTAATVTHITGFANFAGTNLGATTPALASGSQTNIIITTPPSGNGNFVGGGGLEGTTTQSIMPFAIGTNYATGNASSVQGLVTYGTANAGGANVVGVVLLNPSTDYLLPGSSVGQPGGGGPNVPLPAAGTNNVLLDQANNNQGAAYTLTTGTVTVNSLALTNGTTFTQTGGTLNNTANVYAALSGANTLTFSGNNPNATYDVLNAGTTLTLTKPFGGSFTLQGNGTLISTASNNNIGNSFITGTLRTANTTGTNWFNATSALGQIILPGTIDVNGRDLVFPIINGNGFGGAGTITTSVTNAVTPGNVTTLTFQGGAVGNPFVGNFNDGPTVGPNSAKIAVVLNSALTSSTNTNATLLLAGGGTYSGGLSVVSGNLVLGSDTAQGGNTVVNLGGTSASSALLFTAYSQFETFNTPGLFKPSTLGITVLPGTTGNATFGLDIGNQTPGEVVYDGAVTLNAPAYISGQFDEQVTTTTAGVVNPSPLSAAAYFGVNAAGSNTPGNNNQEIFVVDTKATFTGNNLLTQNGGVVQFNSKPNGGNYIIPGGYSVLFGNTQFNLNNEAIPGSYAFATTDGTTPLAVTLNGITMPTRIGQNYAIFTGLVSGAGSYSISSPFSIGPNGGSILSNNTGTTANISYTGAIALGGILAINGTGVTGGGFGNNPVTGWGHYSGTITLNNTGATLGIRYQGGHNNNGDVVQTSSLDSVIQDGVGTSSLPVTFQASDFTGNQYEAFNITGASTYAGGTIIRSAPNIINVTAAGASVGTPAITTGPNATLGTGNVYIEAGGNLQLNAAANVNTAGGATITLAGDPMNTSLLALGYTPASQSALGITANSSGTLALDASIGSSFALNMATLGNGSMFLGSFSTGTYGASTLGVGANAPTPGTAVSTPTYRLGTGGGTNSANVLTISTANVITGAANLIVNLPSARDASDNNLGAPIGNYGGGSTVKFAANQNFTGTITVNGGYMQGIYGTLDSVVQSSGQPFGTGSNNVYLVGGNLQFDMPTGGAGRTDLTIGNLNVVAGITQLTANNNNVVNTLTIGSGGTGIVRPTNGGILLVNNNTVVGNNTPPTFNTKFVVNNATNANAANGSLGFVSIGGNPAPWIMTSGQDGGDFMAYTANGLVPTTYTLAGVVANVNDATGGTFLNQAIPTDIVRIQNTTW